MIISHALEKLVFGDETNLLGCVLVSRHLLLDQLTRTESTVVRSKLHMAIEMKPARSSRLLPARSIKKNLNNKK